MQQLSGKVAVITGAASGFGREFARLGASLGMRLALADVEADALARVVDELRDGTPPTESMRAAQRATEKAVAAGRIDAAQVARMTFDAIRENRFYVITHPNILQSVELRMQDVLRQRNPSDPYTYRPDVAQRPR